jgi:Na+/proline symporter
MLGAGLYLLLGLIPIYLGLVGPVLLPGLKDTEEIVPRLAEAFLPTVAYILFIGAIISAILSVVHATLHAPAAQLSHNVLLRVRPQATAAGKLWTVRLTVAGLSAVAYVLAMSSDSIKDLVETASALGSAGVFVATLFGLFTKFGGAPSAYASILAGTIMWAWCKYIFGMSTPYLIALASAVVAYCLIAIIEQKETSRIRH